MKKYAWILFILFTSCSVFNSNSSKVELNRSWELVEFVDSNGDELSLIENEVHVLRFSDDFELGGEAACNYYGGEYLAKVNGRMSVKKLAVTEILCPQPSLGEEFVEALSNVKSYEMNSGKLVLNHGNQGKLIFLESLE